MEKEKIIKDIPIKDLKNSLGEENLKLLITYIQECIKKGIATKNKSGHE